MRGAEDAYGTRKRLAFASDVIAGRGPAEVLDLGCGSGVQLTWPLAMAHPGVRFTGIDTDERSIEYARRECIAPNLTFSVEADLQPDRRFDLIIASEVMEHVDAPAQFLRTLAGRLVSGGAVLLTTPNGYGPFEFASFAQTFVAYLGARRRTRATPDTLALSPHINFFSWRDIQDIAAAAGLAVRHYRGRTFLCGFGFDHLLRGRRLIEWNSRVADRLPAWMVSDWMLVLEPVAAAGPGSEYRRGPYARMRRSLNERHLGLK